VKNGGVYGTATAKGFEEGGVLATDAAEAGTPRLSVRAWCLKHNLQQSALYCWRRELARRDAAPPATAFVPVRLTEDSPAKSDPVIEVLLANERRILLRDR